MTPVWESNKSLISVDDRDRYLIDHYRWYIQTDQNSGNKYAFRIIESGGTRRRCYLHRQIMEAPRGLVVDHINGNGLDNKRSNMRIATVSQNACNKRVGRNSKSGIKGVFWHRKHGKWAWRAVIMKSGKNIELGRYASIEEAAAAYEKASMLFHGEFGRVSK